MKALAVVVVALVALAGCSSGGSKKGASPTTTATTAPETTIGAGAPKATTAQGTTTTRGPDLALTSFQSPSNNIGCQADPTVVRCDIKDRTWSPPPKPSSCDLDWGQGIEMSGNDNATFVCAGDTALDPTATVLAYGQHTRQGPIVCDSEQAGLTCTNQATNHGFFMSRDSYRIF